MTVICQLSLWQVFTLQSIKSRIETFLWCQYNFCKVQFLLYSPLNQGLKHPTNFCIKNNSIMFLLYSPLNQGLKLFIPAKDRDKLSVFTLQSIKSRIETWTSSLSIVMNLIVFTLQSIKSRIETRIV